MVLNPSLFQPLKFTEIPFSHFLDCNRHGYLPATAYLDWEKASLPDVRVLQGERSLVHSFFIVHSYAVYNRSITLYYELLPCWFSTATSLFSNYWISGSHFVQREVIFTTRILVSSILVQYSEEIPLEWRYSTAFIIGWQAFWTPPTMADTGTISRASISENVHSIVMYICTNFGAFITKWTIGLVCRCTITHYGGELLLFLGEKALVDHLIRNFCL